MDLVKKWTKYLVELEQLVMVQGMESGAFKKKAEEIVPLRKTKLHFTPFANFVGSQFKYDKVLAFNYYGLFKISTQTASVVEDCRVAFPNVRTIKAKVIHFNSIKMEHIKLLAPDLLPDFPDFKRFLVDLRGFK